MSNQAAAKVKELDFSFRVEQLKDACADYLKNNSDEFFSKEDKILYIVSLSSSLIQQAKYEIKGETQPQIKDN